MSSQSPPSTSPSLAPEAALTLRLESQLKRGASWFYWIAGLSLINTGIMFSGSNMRFIFGLGITELVNAVAKQAGPAASIPAVIIDVVIAGLFILFGVMAHKPRRWAFLVGMALYALDGLLFIFVARDLLSVAFHAFALYSMYRGMAVVEPVVKLREAARLKAAGATSGTI